MKIRIDRKIFCSGLGGGNGLAQKGIKYFYGFKLSVLKSLGRLG